MKRFNRFRRIVLQVFVLAFSCLAVLPHLRADDPPLSKDVTPRSLSSEAKSTVDSVDDGNSAGVTASSPKVKQTDLAVAFSDGKVSVNAKGTQTKFKGTLTVTNSGKKAATNVQVGAFLSDFPIFSVATGRLISLIDLSDLGFPTLAKKGGTTGLLTVKFSAKTSEVGPTSGKYLTIVVDPTNSQDDSNLVNNQTSYGPLP